MIASPNSIGDNSNWQPLRSGELEFAAKFRDDNVAASFFQHALTKGFIRTRYQGLEELPCHEGVDELDVERHRPPAIPHQWWNYLLEKDRRTDLVVGRACFGNAWGQPRAVAEGIEVFRPDIVKLISRKGVGGRPIEKIHWQTMTLLVVDIVRNGDLGRFETFTEFKKEILDGLGDALSDRAIDGPAKQLWRQYERSKR